MESLLHDLRYAARVFRKSPTFTLTAVLSLAIGIGANTTMFSAINGILLRPLPYPDSDRLVRIDNVPLKSPGTRIGVSTADVARWSENSRCFDQIGATRWGTEATALSGGGAPERVNLQYFTWSIFPMLGVRPVLGSLSIDPKVIGPKSGPVAIRYEFWQRHFGADPRVVGQSIFLDNDTATVIAVLPPGFDLFGGEPPDVVSIMGVDLADTGAEGRWLVGMGRLKPGITIQQAQASMDALARQLERVYPRINKGVGIKLQPLQEGLFGWSREILYPLFAAVGFVLLIACANIANLLLSRSFTRRKEIGIRTALGAERPRLVRQLLTESVLLSVTGGLIGLLFSIWGIKIFVALAPHWLPQAKGIHIDFRVLAFTAAISILTGLSFGLAPAFRASKADVNDSLKEGGRTSAAGVHQGTRSTLVVLEVALAVILLVSAGLMMNTIIRLLHADPGFHPGHLVTLEVRLVGKKYFNNAEWEKTGLDLVTPQVGIFCKEVLERIRALPGVESAALIDWLPMLEHAERDDNAFTVAGQAAVHAGERNRALTSAISADYFRVMQIPLLKGRELTQQDGEAAPWVAVINDAMAKKYWGNRNSIGQVVRLDLGADSREERPREIVGVVGNVRQYRLGENARPEIYVPYPQQARHCDSSATETRLHKSLILRVRFESQGFITRLRNTVAEVDKNSPVFGIRTVEQTVYESTNLERFYAQLLGVFAVIALLLAAIGVYGVISYTVAERSHEVGVRIALGAQAGQLLRMVLRQGLILSLLGVITGLAGSFIATPLLSSFLYGVQAHDRFTLSLVCVFLVAVTLLATYIPARRATKVDPMVTLRHE